MTKKFYLYIFLLVSHFSLAQNLHFLSVINTDDFNRQDRRTDVENVNKIAVDIAKYMNFTKYTYDFGDSAHYNPTSVRLTLENLKVTPCSEDVVWFHYSGLGGNHGETPLPTMQLFGGALDVKEVENILRKKKPKLVLISVDCSNRAIRSGLISNQADDRRSTYVSIKQAPAAVKEKVTIVANNEVPYFQVIENYNKLFRNFKGTKVVILVSAQKDEDALSDSRKGSLWVQAFSKAFNEVLYNHMQKEIWENGIQKKIEVNTLKLSKSAQHPRLFTYLNSYCNED